MQLFSTNAPADGAVVSFREAVFQSMPQDKGLFMPLTLPRLPNAFFEKIEKFTFQEIAFQVAYALLGEDIPAPVLREIIEDAINFEAPVIALDEQIHVLELFHGPTLAFKDFGARFMARTMSWFLQQNPIAEKIDILVATSGDTGGAVAQGFLGVPGIDVTLLYPKGKVSDLQEKQLTTAGHNVTALEVDGTFDDCQRMVKQAFLDAALRQRRRLSSANSINISRLVPQSFYYFNAYAQLKREPAFDASRPVVFSVPSGNFGNLCGGLIARHMGLPISHMIAATNINDIVPNYLSSGRFEAKPSVQTLSNAMDVGNPSNFARLKAFYKTDPAMSEAEVWQAIQGDISGRYYTDAQTSAAISEVFHHYHGYVMCPHTAVGYLGMKEYLRRQPSAYGVVLSTAHPAKFVDTVEAAIGEKIVLPERLESLLQQEKKAVALPNEYEALREYLWHKA